MAKNLSYYQYHKERRIAKLDIILILRKSVMCGLFGASAGFLVALSTNMLIGFVLGCVFGVIMFFLNEL